MWNTRYVVHGVPLRLVTDSAAVAAAGAALLGAFETADASREGPAAIRIRLRSAASPADAAPELRRSAAAVRAYGRRLGGPHTTLWYELFVHERTLVADFGALGLVLVDYARRTVDGYCLGPAISIPDALPYLCFFAVAEMLKAEGLTAIHAGAVAREGHGVLVPAPSGRGKTTTCIALVRAGFAPLSDDHPLLRTDDRGPELLPFPTPWRVTEPTVALFPELQTARTWCAPGAQKQSFKVHEVYGGAVARSCRPALVLLPRFADATRCHAEPVSRGEALRTLLPCAMLVTDRAASERQFAALAALANSSHAYRLVLGRDVEALPDLVTSLLPPAPATTADASAVPAVRSTRPRDVCLDPCVIQPTS
jgi:hypothetical protein